MRLAAPQNVFPSPLAGEGAEPPKAARRERGSLRIKQTPLPARLRYRSASPPSPARGEGESACCMALLFQIAREQGRPPFSGQVEGKRGEGACAEFPLSGGTATRYTAASAWTSARRGPRQG